MRCFTELSIALESEIYMKMKAEKRVTRICELMKRLEAGEKVSRSSLARVLHPEQLTKLLDTSKRTKGSSRVPKPEEISRYATLLRRCDRIHGKFEISQSASDECKATKWLEKAKAKREETLLYITEIVGTNPTLQVWLDRVPSVGDSSTPENLPRLVSAKCRAKQSSGQTSPSEERMRKLKLAALAEALEELKVAEEEKA